MPDIAGRPMKAARPRKLNSGVFLGFIFVGPLAPSCFRYVRKGNEPET